MKLNVICTQEEQDAIHNYATTIFSKTSPVYINNSFFNNDEDYQGKLIKYVNNFIFDERISTRGSGLGSLTGILLEILKIPNFNPQDVDLSFNDESFQAFNEYLHIKGYTAFVRKTTYQNIPTNIKSDSFMPSSLKLNSSWVHEGVLGECLTTILYGSEEDLGRLYSHTRSEIMRLRATLITNSVSKETLLEQFYAVMNYYHGLDTVQLVYKKVNNLEITKNDISIVSEWAPAFLNQFDITKVNSLPKEDTCAYLPFNSRVFNGYTSRSWDVTRTLTSKYCTFESEITIGQTAAITLVDDTCAYNVENIEEKFNQKLKASILTSDQNRIEGFSLSSYKKSCPNKPFYQVIQNYTRKQAISRNGFFIPYLIPTVIFTQNSEFKVVYYYTFLLFDRLDTLVRKKISKQTLIEFYSNYIVGGGTYYYDPEAYYEELKKGFGPNAFKYSVDFLNLIRTLSPDQLEILKKKNSKELPSYKVFNSTANALITSEPVVESAIKNKYFKFKTKFEKLTNNKESSQRALNLALRDSKAHVDSIVSCNQRIQTLKQEILNYEKLIQEKNNLVKTTIQKLEQYSTAYHSNYLTYTSLQENYNLAVKEAFTQNNFSTNSFFNSLAKDNIKILSIQFVNQDKETKVIDKSSLEETAFLQKLTTSLRASKSKIVEIEFLIDKPLGIIVDANPNKVVYGGPYVVKVQKGNLYIKLAYPNSLFGTDGYTFYVHPHASRPNFRSMIDGSDYSRACLGEAQPLIYNAFEKNDLKLIVLSAMTWVNSANSSDAWGKYWKYFPTKINEIPNQHELNVDESSDITNTEVQEFIENVTDEEDLQHLDAPLLEEPLPNTTYHFDETQQPPQIEEDQPIQDANPAPEQIDPPQHYVRYTQP